MEREVPARRSRAAPRMRPPGSWAYGVAMDAAMQSACSSEAIRPILAGHPPQVQGAAVADLLAIWLAGHPAEVRKSLLEMHLATVHKLIPVNEAMIREKHAGRGEAGVWYAVIVATNAHYIHYAR